MLLSGFVYADDDRTLYQDEMNTIDGKSYSGVYKTKGLVSRGGFLEIRGENMKKKSLLKMIAACCCAVVMLGTACTSSNVGSDIDTETSQDQGDSQQASEENKGDANHFVGEDGTVYDRIDLYTLDLDKYVTIGDYKNLKVEKEEIEVTTEEIDDSLKELYMAFFPGEFGVKDREAVKGDTVNIDYVGKKDDVAFDGGTATGANLTLGSGQYIDGFEDGLIGVKPGETVDLNLTFPENYQSEELAGQAVVFTVTMNYIIPDEIIEEAIPQLGLDDVSNMEELRSYVENSIRTTKEYQNENANDSKILEAFLDTCTFQNLEDLSGYFRAMLKQNVTDYATNYGMDEDSFLGMYYGMDLTTFLDTFTEQTIKETLAMHSLARKEGLEVNDEELANTMKEYMENSQVETEEEFLGGESKEAFREYLTYEKAQQFLLENTSAE